MSELVVTPLTILKYKVWDDQTQIQGAWTSIYTDGFKLYDEPGIISVSKTRDPLRSQDFIIVFQDYIIAKYNPPGTFRIQLFDYSRVEGFKPSLNRKHPWVKELR